MIAANLMAVTGGFAPPAWTPASLGATLKLWLRGDLGVTNASGKASAWADQSGNGNDVTQATAGQRPVINANSINGNQGLTFSSAASTKLTNTTQSPFSSGETREITVVCRPETGATVGGVPIQFRLGAPFWQGMLLNFGATTYGYYNGTVIPSFTVPAITVSTNYVLHWTSSGTALTMTVNGVSAELSNSVPVLSDSGTIGFSVGLRSDDETYDWTGEIDEIIGTNTILGGADATNRDAYILARYGL